MELEVGLDSPRCMCMHCGVKVRERLTTLGPPGILSHTLSFIYGRDTTSSN